MHLFVKGGLAWAVAGVFWAGTAGAHQISAVAAKASFERDGTYRFALSLDVTGSADPTLDEQISPEQAALAYLEEALRFSFDGVGVTPRFGELELVTRPDPLGVEGDLVQLHTEASGKIPPGAKEFQVALTPETDVALVMIVVKDGITQRRAQTLFAGELSRPVDLTFVGQAVEEGDPFAAERSAEIVVPGFAAGVKGGMGRMLAGSGRGALVVVALLLGCGILREHLLQLSVCWVAWVAGQAVSRFAGWEPTAADADRWFGLALAGVALDNVFRGRTDGRRLAVAGGSGALMGICFREAAYEAGWDPWCGYQLGVLAVMIGLALVTWIVLGPFREKEWYGRRFSVPVSWFLAGVGVVWMAAGWWPGR